MELPEPTQSATKFISLREFATYLGVSRHSVSRHIEADPEFPRPVRIGRSALLPLDEVRTYLARRQGKVEV